MGARRRQRARRSGTDVGARRGAPANARRRGDDRAHQLGPHPRCGGARGAVRRDHPRTARERDGFPIPYSGWLGQDDTVVPGLVVHEVAGSKTPGELALVLEGTTLVTGDLIRAHEGGRLCLLPDAKLTDSDAARSSVRRLAALPGIEAVLVGDGWPVFRHGAATLPRARRLVRRFLTELFSRRVDRTISGKFRARGDDGLRPHAVHPASRLRDGPDRRGVRRARIGEQCRNARRAERRRERRLHARKDWTRCIGAHPTRGRQPCSTRRPPHGAQASWERQHSWRGSRPIALVAPIVPLISLAWVPFAFAASVLGVPGGLGELGSWARRRSSCGAQCWERREEEPWQRGGPADGGEARIGIDPQLSPIHGCGRGSGRFADTWR